MADEKMPAEDESKEPSKKEESGEKSGSETKGSNMEQFMPLIATLAAKEGSGEKSGPLWVIGGVLLLGLLMNGGFGGLGGGNAGVDQRLILEQGALLASKIDNSLYQNTLQLSNVQNTLQAQMAAGFCATNENIGKVLCAVEGVNSRIALAEERIIGNQNNLAKDAQIAEQARIINELQRFVPLPVPPTQNVDITGQINVAITQALAAALPQMAAMMRSAA